MCSRSRIPFLGQCKTREGGRLPQPNSLDRVSGAGPGLARSPRRPRSRLTISVAPSPALFLAGLTARSSCSIPTGGDGRSGGWRRRSWLHSRSVKPPTVRSLSPSRPFRLPHGPALAAAGGGRTAPRAHMCVRRMLHLPLVSMCMLEARSRAIMEEQLAR